MDFNKNSEITADEIAEAMTKETPWQIRPEMVTKIKQDEGESDTYYSAKVVDKNVTVLCRVHNGRFVVRYILW